MPTTTITPLPTSDDSCKTYDVNCFGKNTVRTTVTNNPNKATEWISKSINPTTGPIGLDVEWRPRFGPGPENPAATLQLCAKDQCLVYQFNRPDSIPDSLKNLLSDNAHTFAGVGVKRDLEKLERDHGIGGNAKALDLGNLAADKFGRKELKGYGLKGLSEMVLGEEMEKDFRVRTSKWDSPRLTDEQVKYACLDAFASKQIGHELGTRLEVCDEVEHDLREYAEEDVRYGSYNTSGYVEDDIRDELVDEDDNVPYGSYHTSGYISTGEDDVRNEHVENDVPYGYHTSGYISTCENEVPVEYCTSGFIGTVEDEVRGEFVEDGVCGEFVEDEVGNEFVEDEVGYDYFEDDVDQYEDGASGFTGDDDYYDW